MKHCENCGRFIGGRSIKRHCGPPCRAAASRARRNRPKPGEPAHGHRVTVEGLADDGRRWLYGCRDCPATWRGPLSLEALEDVECEAEDRRAA